MRIIRAAVPALASILIIAASGCGLAGGTDAPAQESSTSDSCVAVTAHFSSIQAQILDKSCIGCHGAQGGVNLQTYSEVVNGENSSGQPVVTAGDPSASRLHEVVSTGKMPLGASKLCDAKIEAIRKWIADGAADD